MKKIGIFIVLSCLSVSLCNFAKGDEFNDFDTFKNAVSNLSASSSLSASIKENMDFLSTITLDTNKTVEFDGNGKIVNGQNKVPAAFEIKQDGTLTLKNITFTNFNGKDSGWPYAAAISSSGNLTITADTGKDVVFENNKGRDDNGRDLGLSGGAKVLINGSGGKVVFGSGIFGDKSNTIAHEGNSAIELAGQNSYYTGSFTNNSGDVTVEKDATFFGGKSAFNGGILKWFTKNNLLSTAALNLNKGSSLELGNGVDSSVLTIKSGSSIDGADSIKIAKNSKLNINRNTSFSGTLSGDGTLSLNNSNVTLQGNNILTDASDFTIIGNNSTLTFKDNSSLANAIAAVVKDFDSNTSLNLVLDSVSGEFSNELNIEGTHLKSLTFNKTNNLSSGNININTENGFINNGRTTLGGNLNIAKDATALNSYSLTLNGDGENLGTFTNNGTLKGKFKNAADANLISTGTIYLDSLENDGNVNAQSGTFSAGNVDNKSKGTINAKNAFFKNLKNEGNITADTININDGSYDLLTNSGQITTNSLTVDGYIANNSGTINVSGESKIRGKLKNASGANFITGKGSINDIENQGKITNNGDLTISGSVSGSGDGAEIINSGNLTLDGNAGSYTGKYTQSAGSTIVNGKLFNGIKDIQQGSLKVTNNDLNYEGAIKLGSGASLDFSAIGTENKINSDKLTFEGTNASATFKGTGYSLADNISGKGNSITFKDTVLSLDGADYSSSAKLTLDNSTLNLLDEKISDYTLGDFEAKNNSLLDFDININGSELTTDTLTFNSSNAGQFGVGRLYISSENETGQNSYSTRKNVLNGNITFNNLGKYSNTDKITYATKDFTYDVFVYNKTIGLQNAKASGENALNDMNIHSDSRQFKAQGDYQIAKDLDKTESGTFMVFGGTRNNKNDMLNGNSHSFFNIEKDKTTYLDISDLTIHNADNSLSKGGSVLRNESASSNVRLRRLVVQNNTSKGSTQGGAIYNNAGSGVNPSDSSFTGLYVSDSEFSSNGLGVNGLGGALYNDENGFLYLENVTFNDGSADAKNDIYNKGTAYTNGSNVFSSLFTNEGNLTFQGSNKLSEFENNAAGSVVFSGSDEITKFKNDGTAEFSGANATLGSVEGSNKGTITHSNGTLTLADGQNYLGSYTQSAGHTILDSDSNFFGGNSTINGGILDWYTKNDIAPDAALNVLGSDTYLRVGNESTNTTLTLRDGSSVSSESNVLISDGSSINVNGGSLSLNENDVWAGDITIDDGNLSFNNLNSNGKLNATGGNVSLDSGNLVLNNGSAIDGTADMVIEDDASLYILDDAEVTLNSGDVTKGHTILQGGVLNYEEGVSAEGDNTSLEAYKGDLNIQNGGKLTLDSDKSVVAGDVNLSIAKDSSVDLTVGSLQIDDKDSWEGKISVNGGTLNYHTTNSGELEANSGNLNLLDGSVLDMEGDSNVKHEVVLDIQKGSTVNIKSGTFEVDSKDTWHGLVHNDGGIFHAKGLVEHDSAGGQLQQSSGESIFDEQSNVTVSGDNTIITGGTVSIYGDSHVGFSTGNNITLDGLNLAQNSSFSILNDIAQTVQAGNLNIEDNNDFMFDLSLRGGQSDKMIFDNITSTNGGNINVSDFSFLNGAPTQKNIELQLFDSSNISDNITFSATDKQVMTPIGEYGLSSLGGGKFRASLGRFNPTIFRGQAASLAMYNNQLAVNDILLNHIILHSEKNEFANGKMANRYAAVNPLFAPYQYTRKEGGLWFKSYVDIERLSMSQNIDVNNTAYGSLIGADLAVVNLKHGWDFIPTFYVGYNGSRQSFHGVKMYQNGGQGGFMGTFMRKDFIGSALVYGGGYSNEMDVSGYTDRNGNWFVGTAAKAAYNFHPAKHFIIQPTAMISYNMFGKQSWNTDFGMMNMNTGMLNGINVAPGLNLIYARDTWSTYATFQYMFNANDKISGHAGTDVDLPRLSMEHGYFQYGVGVTKTWKERLNSYFQVTLRNGGRTSIGFQAGLQYSLDWAEFFQVNRISKLFKKKAN